MNTIDGSGRRKVRPRALTTATRFIASRNVLLLAFPRFPADPISGSSAYWPVLVTSPYDGRSGESESPMPPAKKARAIGFNHVALEGGDIDEALTFYGRLFDFELRGKSKTSAFIDLGDQFLALQKGRTQAADDGRHFGLVVDDKDAVRRALAEAGVDALPGQFLDFVDPWGNRVEIVSYENIQFTKAPNVLRGMGLSHLPKNQKAIEELSGKGMAPK